MANITKQKRDEMLAFLEELKQQHTDDASIRAFNEIENHLTEKKFGLVFEEHTEEVDEILKENIPVFCSDEERRLCKDPSLPWNFIIEGDNLQALYLLEKTHLGKVDCIYIDPPYNKGNKDWKYNNDYVDANDTYRHSKWLSMMKSRLLIAKRLLNPKDSVLICTIDEKEYLHLGCLLEELFPDANIQMISDATNPKGVFRSGFSRNDEYIFFVMVGCAIPTRLKLGNEWSASAAISRSDSSGSSPSPAWTSMMRRGSHSSRSERPGLYYPIYADPLAKMIRKIGSPLPFGTDRGEDFQDLVQILPIRTNGTQGCWQVGPEELESRIAQGRVRLGRETSYGYVVNYLPDGAYKEVLSDMWVIDGYADDNSILAHRNNDFDITDLRAAPTQWKIASHNASENGSTLIKDILINKRFEFPKSLYSESDAIRFFVAAKPDAIIIDFFAGSGTTQHAVNLLNAEDGGLRRCIMVTNNEISADEEKRLTKDGFHKGDPEWEDLGVARYVTWPRTVCSIEGHDISGNPLKGEYLVKGTDGKPLPMSAGFNCNIKYFKCGWTPRKPEDYLLSNALCLHIREMIELQNAIEIDNVKNVLVLNKEDFEHIVLNPEVYAQIENIWVNQNIVFGSEELRLLADKGFKYIPREFFGQELREAAE